MGKTENMLINTNYIRGNILKKVYDHICDYCGNHHEISSTIFNRLLYGKQKKCYCSIECKSNAQHTGHMVVCDYCGKSFYRRQYRIDRQSGDDQHIFCCVECEFNYKKDNSIESRKCEWCNKEYKIAKSSSQRFCSPKCQHEWQTTLTGTLSNRYNSKIVHCSHCGKEFSVKESKYNRQENFFCSKECLLCWNGIINLESYPQTIVNDILNLNGISYQREFGAKYYAIDNYLPDYNLMIEVMGDYWHCNPTIYNAPKNEIQSKALHKDKAKHTYILKYYDINILYLWEYDIINHPDMCEKMILDYIKNDGALRNYHSFNYDKKEEEYICIGY